MLPRVMFTYIQNLVDSLLWKLNVFRPAVSTRRLAKYLGIPIQLHDLPFIDGWTARSETGRTIWVRASLPRPERRIVVAHELGHILLGHLENRSEFRGLKEMAANLFALELLLPTRLWSVWKRASLTEIAIRFKVPETWAQAKQLNLIPTF